MAHNIANINGKDAIAYLGSTPWHSLGTRLKEGQKTDLQEVRIAAGLDWKVSTAPIFLADGRPVIKGQAIIRDTDSAILSVVGPAYTPIQNEAALEILRPAIDAFGLTVEVAGALGQGEVGWALTRLPQSVEVVDGDSVNGYALFRWSHDGSVGVVGDATPIRVVCQNTLNMARSESKADIVRVRHTKRADQRLDEAARIVKTLTQALVETGKTFKSLAHKRLNAQQVKDFIEEVLPESAANTAKGTVSDVLANRRKTISELVWRGKGAELALEAAGGNPSPWALYNAVTEYFDHVRPAEAKSNSARVGAQESALFGGNAAIKARALDMARELVAA